MKVTGTTGPSALTGGKPARASAGFSLGQTGAIVDASKASITFFSDAGLAGRNDAPAKVRLYVQANADGTQTVRSQVWAPTQTSTGWTCRAGSSPPRAA